MPEGVEHKSFGEDADSSALVRTALMPEGVEHECDVILLAHQKE